MPKLSSSTPKYRKHRASGQAVVTIAGRDRYLGPWKSKASLAEYDRVIAEWLVNGRQAPLEQQDALTVSEVLARFWGFAKGHYRKGGKSTESLGNIRDALRPFRRLYGHTKASDFGPLALKAVRQSMIDTGLARNTINKRVGTIKQVFKWAVSEELVAPAVHQALATVAGLQRGRTPAPEPEPVLPVSEALVQATLPHLPPIVADMVLVQRLTGCRPGEVCIVRPGDIDRSDDDVWAYRPESHKAEHRGRGRIVFIGPKAQTILRPYLLRGAETYCFSPAESVEALYRRRGAKRQTPLSCGNRPGSNRRRRPKRQAGDRYTTNTYRRAIHRACDLAGVEKWGPNRLRHSAATEIRREYGLEAAQTVLGHAQANITQVYAERDAELARAVMRKIG